MPWGSVEGAIVPLLTWVDEDGARGVGGAITTETFSARAARCRDRTTEPSAAALTAPIARKTNPML
jgi:hypothetical protein